MKKWLNPVALGWSMIILSLFAYTDANLKISCNSDYLMTFFVGGHLVREGRMNDLYPSPSASSFIDSSFDRAAHRVLADLGKQSTAEYMYPPVTAFLFAPLSLLSPSWSLLAWQILLILSLAASVLLILKGVKEAGIGEAEEGPQGLLHWAFGFYLPLVITIWIGQASVAAGLLPLCLGYWLLMKRKELWAGLAWSLCLLKPQFLVAAILVMLVKALDRSFKTLLGFIIGAALFVAVNVAAFSGSLFSDWLRCVKLSDAVYSDLKFGVASHLMICLPRAVLLLFPPDRQPMVKIVVFGLAAVFFIATLSALHKWSASQGNKQLVDSAALVLASLVTPLVVPYMFLYDLSLWVLPGLLVANIVWPDILGRRLRQAMLLLWISVNLYTIVVLAHKDFALPLVLIAVMFAFWLRVIIAVGRFSASTTESGEDQGAPQ